MTLVALINAVGVTLVEFGKNQSHSMYIDSCDDVLGPWDEGSLQTACTESMSKLLSLR